MEVTMSSIGRRATGMIALGIAAVLAVPGAVPASANTRQTTLVEFNGTNPDTGFCDFPVTDTEQGTFMIADQFDNDGVLARTIVTSFGQLTLTFTNPTNGKSAVTHNESQVIIVDWQADGSRETVRRMGVAFAFTYPGLGVILLQVGYFEHNNLSGSTFTAGPHDLFEGDFDELCAALA
jgi:hypothetical protein